MSWAVLSWVCGVRGTTVLEQDTTEGVGAGGHSGVGATVLLLVQRCYRVHAAAVGNRARILGSVAVHPHTHDMTPHSHNPTHTHTRVSSVPAGLGEHDAAEHALGVGT